MRPFRFSALLSRPIFASPARPWANMDCVPGYKKGAENLRHYGAPEEIRTPDPQIRSLIVSTALIFLDFP